MLIYLADINIYVSFPLLQSLRVTISKIKFSHVAFVTELIRCF